MTDTTAPLHAGIHEASIGWILPHLYDPDGYDLRFYTFTLD